jgi:hypothetical protein
VTAPPIEATENPAGAGFFAFMDAAKWLSNYAVAAN